MALAAPLSMAACGDDALINEDEDAAEKERVQFFFTIDMGGSSSGTRSTWGDGYTSEDATYYENTIDPDKFQVLLFGRGGAYLDELSIISYSRHGDTESNLYDVEGMVNVDKGYVVGNTLQCKIVVLANYDDNSIPALTEASTLSDLEDITFDIDNHLTEDIAAGTAFIPMFGVTTADLKVNAGAMTDAGTVYMLRAMAKIGIKLDDGDSNADGKFNTGEELSMTSVTLTKANQRGYIVPKGFASADNTKSLSMEDGTFNPLDGTSLVTDLLFINDGEGHYYAYVPEYTNSERRRTLINIKFDFQTDTDTDTYPVQVAEYDRSNEVGDYYDIGRNIAYTFTITKNKGEFSVVADDWVATFDNEYTFDNDL